jgi:hypothetical protein
MAWLLGRHSDSYASKQFGALQQIFRWQAAEDDLPEPVGRFRLTVCGLKRKARA